MDFVTRCTTRLQELRSFASVKHRRIGLSLLRVCLGTVALAFCVLHVHERAFLWGNQGLIPFSSFVDMLRSQHTFSLYELSPSPYFALALFWGGILVTVAFTLGYKTRWSSILFFIFVWSIDFRNPFILDGGDNLLYLVAFFLIFVDCGYYFSLDAFLRQVEPARENPFIAMLHNYALLAILIQLCLLYFTSVFYKIQGHMWQDGTAIYYILRTSEFNLSPIERIFYGSALTVTLLTYSTLVLQMAWPFLIWNRKTRPFIALGAYLFHAMIGYFMGLIWFSAIMVSAELVVFDDREYRWATDRLILPLCGLLAEWRRWLYLLGGDHGVG